MFTPQKPLYGDPINLDTTFSQQHMQDLYGNSSPSAMDKPGPSSITFDELSNLGHTLSRPAGKPLHSWKPPPIPTFVRAGDFIHINATPQLR